ncbi:PaaI family thioesterase [Acidobacteriota bacterium]
MAIKQISTYRQQWSLRKKKYHSKCIFNDLYSYIGRDLEIDFDKNGDLVGSFFCHEKYQGYDGIVHGGILSALLDSAMVQCLMGHGVVAYTARMNIRYINPVKLGQYVNIFSCIKQAHFNKLYKLYAEITQDRTDYAVAHASFYRIIDKAV